MAESYLQHAEHYFRLIAAAQQAQQQAAGTFQRLPGEALVDENEDDSDFGGIPDRFASPAERFFQAPQPSLAAQPQPSPAQPTIDRPFHESAERQGGDRQGSDRQNLGRSERGPRPERSYQDRNYRDREYQSYPEKPYQDQRPYHERNGRARDQDGRGNRGRAPRDYRNETSIRIDPREEPRMADAVIEGNGLPAFITAPVRVQAESHDPQPIEPLAPLLASTAEVEEGANGFHPRPRRRRRSKPEAGAEEARASEAGTANEAAQD